MSEELKPCPFCGGEGDVIERINPMSKWRWSVDCTSTTCGMSGPVEASKAEAITAWNSRTTDAEIARLRAENAELRADKDALYKSYMEMKGTADELQRKLDEAVKALEHIATLKRGIMIDVGSCHKLRWPAASSEMRSDDRELRDDMEAAFAKISAALTSIRGEA